MGGLNYQIEHHLFPSMARPHLKRTGEIVREYCEARGIDYTEVGLFKSYGIVIRYLNEVGSRRRWRPVRLPRCRSHGLLGLPLSKHLEPGRFGVMSSPDDSCRMRRKTHGTRCSEPRPTSSTRA